MRVDFKGNIFHMGCDDKQQINFVWYNKGAD